MSDESTALAEPSEPNHVAAYFCRGCGNPLPESTKARFHTECLRMDKRRRVTRQRERVARRDERRFRTQLRRPQCPDCGTNLVKLANGGPGHSVKVPREASQRASDALEFAKRLDGNDAAAEPAARL